MKLILYSLVVYSFLLVISPNAFVSVNSKPGKTQLMCMGLTVGILSAECPNHPECTIVFLSLGFVCWLVAWLVMPIGDKSYIVDQYNFYV
jgi:hypothetical protein